MIDGKLLNRRISALTVRLAKVKKEENMYICHCCALNKKG
jgi:hypothetical protein